MLEKCESISSVVIFPSFAPSSAARNDSRRSFPHAGAAAVGEEGSGKVASAKCVFSATIIFRRRTRLYHSFQTSRQMPLRSKICHSDRQTGSKGNSSRGAMRRGNCALWMFVLMGPLARAPYRVLRQGFNGENKHIDTLERVASSTKDPCRGRVES